MIPNLIVLFSEAVPLNLINLVEVGLLFEIFPLLFRPSDSSIFSKFSDTEYKTVKYLKSNFQNQIFNEECRMYYRLAEHH